MSAKSAKEITARVGAKLPKWKVEGNFLTRTYTTRNWQQTLLLADTIAYLAEAAWHHPDLTLGYKQLTVRLQTHDAGNIVTEKDLELAQKIEEVATWQPNPGGALPGRKDWVV